MVYIPTFSLYDYFSIVLLPAMVLTVMCISNRFTYTGGPISHAFLSYIIHEGTSNISVWDDVEDNLTDCPACFDNALIRQCITPTKMKMDKIMCGNDQ